MRGWGSAGGVVVVGWSACGGTPSDLDGSQVADTDPVEPATSDPPDFQADIVPLFFRSCGAGQNACHSAVAYHPLPPDCLGWLSLEDAPLGSVSPTTGEPTGCPDVDLYTRLLERPGWGCFVEGMEVMYVAAGDLAESYLWQKVLPNGLHCYGSEAMPLAGEIDPGDRALLEAWIRDGAPR